ncbi:YobI family P-loop NTPase [Roseivirga echinicomitans]
MNTIITKAIYYLQRIIAFLQKRIPKEIQENTTINSLAPKTLTDSKDLERIKPYLDNLKQAIEAKGINNIAITGSYGSGKSTVLKTFQDQNSSYEFLNISLASFKENKDGQESLERRLEISILQQMFYHVDPSVIPDSRFKRIVNVSEWRLTALTSLFILWLFSSTILFIFGYAEKLNPVNWRLSDSFDWITFVSFLVFVCGFGLIINKIYRLFKNSKINKLSIKGELELGDAVDKSVFNQHLEEIIYFFERTDFNVVVIEDVDRFDSTDIFTKLREINILLNDSDLIKRPIKFLYAIKDDMFTDKTERVKFFEFIIPVIPFINPGNANDQLTRLITNANLQDVLSEEFTSDIVTFIDDIDMRLLINIFQEYQVYERILNLSIGHDNLFAILVYKNIYPDDFGDLARRKGKLYSFLANKSLYISSLKNDLNTQISDIDDRLKLLEREIKKPIEELRAVYINRLIAKLPQFHKLDNDGRQVSVNEAVEDEYFNKIKQNIPLTYFQYSARNWDINYSRKNTEVKLSDIEKDISRSLTYIEREKLLTDKKNNQAEVLKLDKAKLKNRITELENLSIQEIFELIEINDYLGDFGNSYLMRNLLLNGYIDENFDDYISLFHEVSITKSDFVFEKSVKAGISLDFKYELEKTENLIKRIPDKYFQRDVILNYSLIRCLLDNQLKFSKQLDNIFKCLKMDESKQFDFIHGFINNSPQHIALFIELLCSDKTGLWYYINEKSDLPDSEIQRLIRLIFEYANLDDVNRFDNVESLVNYFENLSEPFAFLGVFDNTNNVEKFISDKKIKFINLDLPKENQTQLFQQIYTNEHYQISEHNIEAIIKGNKKEYDTGQLQESNYTTLLKLELKPLYNYIDSNIEGYILNVMTLMKENTEESEGAILNILNRKSEELSNKVKEKVLVSQKTMIQSINDIENVEIQQLALSHDRVVPNWENVFEYYNEISGEDDKSDFDKVLVDFLNRPINYEELCKVKINSSNATNDLIKKISNKILHGNKLTDSAFTKLLASLPYVYKQINYDGFSRPRLDILLDKNILTLSPENIEGLKQIDRSLSLRLIEDKQDKLIQDFTNLSLDSDDWLGILKSSRINGQIKLELVQSMDDSIIIDNLSVANIVCDLLPTDKRFPMNFEVLEAMFKANVSIKKRVHLLNLNFPDMNDEQIQSLTERLGKDYKKIFMKQHKPLFPNNDYNLDFFIKLQDRGLIIRYKLNEKGDKIKVIAMY